MRLYFTLVELLIVISIITILTCLLLPALNNARETVKKIACGNNLKNINLAEIHYVDDNNGYFTIWSGGTDIAGYDIYWHNILNPYLGGMDITHREFQRKAKSFSSLWYCPSQIPYYATYSGNERYTSFGLNQNICCYPSAENTQYRNLNRIRSPSQICTFLDTYFSSADTGLGYFIAARSRVSGRHRNWTCNFAWIDGHLSSIKVSDAWTYNNWQSGLSISGYYELNY